MVFLHNLNETMDINRLFFFLMELIQKENIIDRNGNKTKTKLH